MVIYIVIALIPQVIAPYNPKSFVDKPLLPPSSTHPFGTDNLGRDVFSESIYGARVSLFVGVVIALITSTIGMTMGALAGYYGGIIDTLVSGATELFLVISTFFLALMLSTMFGGSVFLIIMAACVILWTRTARIIRGEFLSLREKEFVMSAKAVGASNISIIFREILPYGLRAVITNGTLTVAEGILLEAGLSFLGMGDSNAVSLGLLLNYAQLYIDTAWWMAVGPGALLSGVVLAFNLVGDAINITLNPKVRIA